MGLPQYGKRGKGPTAAQFRPLKGGGTDGEKQKPELLAGGTKKKKHNLLLRQLRSSCNAGSSDPRWLKRAQKQAKKVSIGKGGGGKGGRKLLTAKIRIE